MIVITGATGALNGATVDHLLARMPAEHIAVVARDPAKAQRFTALGIDVRLGDYADPSSLPRAFDGADQLLLVSSSDPGADAVSLHQTAIDAAVGARVGRILYTSHQGAALSSPFIPARHHAATERLLADSGVAWTSLRNGFYSHALGWLAGPWRDTGIIAVPADGPVSWTSRDDEAEAAAAVISSDGAYDGPITLTAAAAPTMDDIAVMASDESGRTIERRVVGDEDWVDEQVASGSPEMMARFTLGIYRAAREGLFAGVDPLLAALLGRDPRSARDALRGVHVE